MGCGSTDGLFLEIAFAMTLGWSVSLKLIVWWPNVICVDVYVRNMRIKQSRNMLRSLLKRSCSSPLCAFLQLLLLPGVLSS